MLALVIWSRRSQRGNGTPLLAQVRGRLALTQIKKCAINSDNDFAMVIYRANLSRNIIIKAM
jgi:hypothetical protein